MHILIWNTTYACARIVLYPGTETANSTDWYGFGMNSGQIVCNVAAINANGLTVRSSTLATHHGFKD